MVKMITKAHRDKSSFRLNSLSNRCIFVAKRSANEAASTCFCLRESKETVAATTAGGWSGVIIGRDAFSLHSPIHSLQSLIRDVDPQELAQPPHNQLIHMMQPKY
ncbi:hypothetical protein ACZ11_00655 [Lysinibacillus xylanilyticus]|uniref:Uncharacterized protein n=1 Tax=Lysinibacillus xylanilyticus TaxID=582475 RepID=A0A0K9FHD3_9BACI|nr:hypothetical protein ACZ11_00655 [Lysinibacillus xylanilyticus]